MTTTRKAVLTKRPDGEPVEADFSIEEAELPELQEGEVLLKVEHLSIDAFIRTTLDGPQGLHGTMDVGTPVMALGIGRVVDSRSDELNQGDAVFGPMGAQTHVIWNAAMLRKVEETDVPARTYLGALGMTTGLTAYAGMLVCGKIEEGDTVVVSAAAGAVGSIACQLAKIAGARVIGIAGGPDKCKFLTEVIGCDEAADYKAFNLKIESGKYIFDVKTPSKEIKNIEFYLPGKHNVMNALVALAMADVYGISLENISLGSLASNKFM